jgi:hypothetical protein
MEEWKEKERYGLRVAGYGLQVKRQYRFELRVNELGSCGLKNAKKNVTSCGFLGQKRKTVKAEAMRLL